VGAFLEQERGKCQCIGAHNHGGKAMPEGKGFGVQKRGSIGDVKETKRFENKMSRSLWRGISLFIEGELSLKPTKGCRLASALVVSVIEPIESNLLVDACHRSRINANCRRPIWLATGQRS